MTPSNDILPDPTADNSTYRSRNTVSTNPVSSDGGGVYADYAAGDRDGMMSQGKMNSFASRLGWSQRTLFRREYLKSLGFEVKTILDVGVNRGTRELYEAFNDCLFVLVDPLRNVESLVRHKPARYVLVNKGLAATPGRLPLHEQDAGKTTFLLRTALTTSPTVATYEVETITLDMLLASVDFDPPIGIKIDTEGFELEVLKGLEKYWSIVQFVICESSIRRRFVDSYQMSDLVSYMLEHGLVIFNFLNAPEPRPRYYDLLFVPRTSHLLD